MLLLWLLASAALAEDFGVTSRPVFHGETSLGAGAFLQGLAGVEDGRFGARPTWASPYFVGDYVVSYRRLRLLGGGWLAPVVIGEDDVSIPIPGGGDAGVGFGGRTLEVEAVATLPIPAVGFRAVVRRAGPSSLWGLETRAMWAPELWGAVASVGVCWTPTPFEWTLDSDNGDASDSATQPAPEEAGN